MFEKPARLVGVSAASEPPAMTASQRSQAMRSAARVMPWVPAAQAVTIDSHGPCHPYFIDTEAPAELGIIIGTRTGDTRRGPFSALTTICFSRVQMPPMPVATDTAMGRSEERRWGKARVSTGRYRWAYDH